VDDPCAPAYFGLFVRQAELARRTIRDELAAVGIEDDERLGQAFEDIVKDKLIEGSGSHTRIVV
jgi:hypothetical protein